MKYETVSGFISRDTSSSKNSSAGSPRRSLAAGARRDMESPQHLLEQ